MSWMLSQIWQLPFLVVFLFGLALALSGKWKGQFLAYATAAFVVLLVGMAVSTYQQYLMFSNFAAGNYVRETSLNMLLSFAGIVIRVVGYGLLLAAIFVGRSEPRKPG